MSKEGQSQTIVGILASHDDIHVNEAITEVLTYMYLKDNDILKSYHFCFSGGTFDRVVLNKDPKIEGLTGKVQQFFLDNSTRLPDYENGGIHLMSYLIMQKRISILFPFISTITNHHTTSETDALLRLCELWGIKVMMNRASVIEWFNFGASLDRGRNFQKIPLEITLEGSQNKIKYDTTKPYYEITNDLQNQTQNCTEIDHYLEKRKNLKLVLIYDGQAKQRVLDFVIDNENKLATYFDRIYTTSTTGLSIKENCPKLEGKIHRYRSAYKGGFIELATEIIFGNCDAVILFSDREDHKRGTSADFKVVFGAGQRRLDAIRMYTSEFHAREWFDRAF